MRLGEAGDDAGEGGLAGAGRAPEDHGGHLIGLNRLAEEAALADEVFLADELIEGLGAHASGERGLAGGAAGGGLGEHIGGFRTLAGGHFGGIIAYTFVLRHPPEADSPSARARRAGGGLKASPTWL